MKIAVFAAGLLTFGLPLASIAETSAEARQNWPQWRGPLGTGAAPEADPPLEWSETKNIKWKAALPGDGSSTPAVWGDRVFVLTAVRAAKSGETRPAEGRPADARPPGPTPSRDPGPPPGGRPPGGPGGPPPGFGGPGPGPGPGAGRPGGPGGFGGGEKPTESFQFIVLCLDRGTGKVLWQKVAREEVPHEGIQPNNTYASSSPVTDGKVVVAFFGSHGLYCYDLDGNLKWSKQLGQMRTRNGFGEGASPALFGDTIVVDWDDETDNDFIAAFDKRDGKELWRTPRNEPTSWSTPLIVDYQNKPQVVVNATAKVRSYDLATGKEIWSCAGQTANAIPSPVADAETVYCTSGFRGAALYAIKLSASGDIAGTDAIRWTRNKATPYVPSPLLVDDMIYYISGNNGILSSANTKTGDVFYEQERLEEIREAYASPVAARDRVYILSRDGKCVVLKRGPKVEILATNRLDDKTDGSIALAGKDLFVRGKANLYCIAER